HKAKRAEAAADVSTDVHDEALNTTNFQLANGIVEALGEVLTHRTREGRHADITDIWRYEPVRQAAWLDHWGPIFGRSVWDANCDFALVAVETADPDAMVAPDTEVRRFR